MTLTTTSNAGDLLPASVIATGASCIGASGSAVAKANTFDPGTFAGLIADAQVLAGNDAQPTALPLQTDTAQAIENHPSSIANDIDILADATADPSVPTQPTLSATATAPRETNVQLPDASASAEEIASMLAASKRSYPSATEPVHTNVPAKPTDEGSSANDEAIEAETYTASQQIQAASMAAETIHGPVLNTTQVSSAADRVASAQTVLQNTRSDGNPADPALCAVSEIVSVQLTSVSAKLTSSKSLSPTVESGKVTHTRATSSKSEPRNTEPVQVSTQIADTPVPQLTIVPLQIVFAQATSSQTVTYDSTQPYSIGEATPRTSQQNIMLPQQIDKLLGTHGSDAAEESESAPVDTDAAYDANEPQQTDALQMETLPIRPVAVASALDRSQQSNTIASSVASAQGPAQTASTTANQTSAKHVRIGTANATSKPTASPSTNKVRTATAFAAGDGNGNNLIVTTKPTIPFAAPAFASVAAPATGTARDGATVQTSALNAVATVISSMDQSALHVAEPHNQPVGIAIGLNDAQLGPVQIHAELASTGEVHIGISGQREQAQAVIEQITPLMHAAVTQQADAQGSAMSFRIAASSAGSSLAGDTPGQGAQHQSSSLQGSAMFSSGGGLAQHTPQRESRQGSSHSGTYRNGPVAQAEENYASLPRSPSASLFAAVPASRSYGNLSVRI